MLPFTTDEFFAVFARYNQAVWPAPIALVVLASIAVGASLSHRSTIERIPAGVLGVLWVWMALAYHWAFFARINPAAKIFGGAFMLEGLLFWWYGVARNAVRFELTRGLRGTVAICMLLYALVAYPLLGLAAGHRYPAVPTFGAPCPTTIFTLGLMAIMRSPAVKAVFVIPVLWSVIGAFAAFRLNVPQDLGLLAAGALAPLVAFSRRPAASST
jgi:Family of unknown function (DUF6064)